MFNLKTPPYYSSLTWGGFIHVKASQIKFILAICKTKVGTCGKRRKTLRSLKSAAPSINNLKRFTLSDISLEVKIIKKNKRIYNRNKVT